MEISKQECLIRDSDNLVNIEKIQLTALNRGLLTFIDKVHPVHPVHPVCVLPIDFKETEEYKALLNKLSVETQRKIQLEDEKRNLELRVKAAEESLGKKRKENEEVVSKGNVNEIQIKIMQEKNAFLYEIYKKVINELQQQIHDSEVQINVYMSGLMVELQSLKEEYESTTALEVQRYKEENKILKDRMNKMMKQDEDIIEISSKYEATITKLLQEISSQKEKIQSFESRKYNLQKIDVGQEITTYRMLLKKGYLRIIRNPPAVLGEDFPDLKHEEEKVFCLN